MKSLFHKTSPFTNVRKPRQEPSTAWSFRTGVGIDIKFGMPKHNCRFHGICRLDIDESDFDTPPAAQCGTGKGILFIPHSGYCLICFDKNSLTEATRDIHFQRKYFVLEEAVPISKALAIHLGKSIYLNAGQYRIVEKSTGYGVLFGITYSTLNKTEL